MTLNHIQITNAKPRNKAYNLTDSGGLYLVVQPNEAKLWRMNYRYAGRQKTLYFGSWPEVGISAARQKRDDAKKELASGLDPAAEKRLSILARKVAADNNFKAIAEEWVDKNEREGRAPITLSKIRWLEIIAVIERIRDQLSEPILYVTHDRAEAALLSSNLVTLSDAAPDQRS